MFISPVIKSSIWDYSNESQIDFKFISFSYLHCKAEGLCGYDCIEGNFDFALKLINLRMFLSVLLLEDGTLVDVIVIPYIKHISITSLICLCDDYEGITNALFTYDKDKNVNITMNDDEEKYLFINYPEFKEIYIKYNHYILNKIKKCEPIFDYCSYQIPFFEDRIANNLYEIFINYFQNNFNTNLNIDFKDILVEIIFILPESAREYKN